MDFTSSGWLGLFADGATLSDEAAEVLVRTETAIVYLNGDTRELHRRLLSRGITKIVGIDPPVISPPESFPEKTRCFEIAVDGLSERHAVRRIIDPLTHCGAGMEAMREALDPSHHNLIARLAPAGSEFLSVIQELNPPSDYFAIHPGSGGRTKCWSPARFAELAARISKTFNLVPLVIFGPADEWARAEFEAAMPGDVVWQAIENRSLRDVLTLLDSCRFYIGNDSGMSHLAARVAPVLSIFGPTDPEVWAPIGERVRVIQAAGGDLNALGVDTVFDALQPYFSDTSTPLPDS